MPDGNLYDTDFHAWALDQAERLRAAARVQAPELEGIDFEHVIEEVADLGNSERRQVASQLSVALEHMIKIATMPESDFVRGWRADVVAAIRNARNAFSPSMVQRLDGDAIWRHARSDALQILAEDGICESDVPVDPLLGLSEMLEDDLTAIELLQIFLAKMEDSAPRPD